jgi:hypothetical protein
MLIFLLEDDEMKNVLVFVSCLMILAMAANADVVVFQDGLNNQFFTDTDTSAVAWNEYAYQGTHDNYVSAYGSSRDYNMGQSQYMSAGNPNWYPLQQGLLKFDLSMLPAGAIINSATLEIWSRGCGYPDQEVTVHEMKPANGGWVEGSKAGAPGTGDDSTWNKKNINDNTGWAGGYGPCNWANPAYSGGEPDYDMTPLATLMRTDNTSTSYQGFTFELPASIVQSWVIADIKDAAGLVFHASATGLTQELIDADWSNPYDSPSMVNFLASDYATGQYTYSLRPKLTIDYVPEPMTMVLLGLGGLMIRRKR